MLAFPAMEVLLLDLDETLYPPECGVLRRVACPQGVWARRADGAWQRTDLPTHELAGGQETATRPVRGVLGAAPAGRQALDRHLPEIAALIDPHQFEVITARDAGVVARAMTAYLAGVQERLRSAEVERAAALAKEAEARAKAAAERRAGVC